MKNTKPFFIVSTGRSGTQMMEKLFNYFDDVEMHHEYMVNIIQPISVQYYMGLISQDDVCKILKETYESSIFYSKCHLWGDSSNKLACIIDCLNKVFPEAKFIHLVRDGRKVVSSFYHKLNEECYDDKSVEILQRWISKPKKFPKPPPEKKYWWNIPIQDKEKFSKFEKFNQFERICFHWEEINEVIIKHLVQIEPERKRVYKLEELVSDVQKTKDLLEFLELRFDESIFELLKKPHNVNIPKDFPLNKIEEKQFFEIAGRVMQEFKYDKEYSVDYHGDNPIKYD